MEKSLKSLLKFELNRIIKSKVFIMINGMFVLMFLIIGSLNYKVSYLLGYIENYYIVYSQFGFLFFCNVVALGGFALDYEKNYLFFYLQNDIDLKYLYIVKNFIFAFLIAGINTIMYMSYIVVLGIPWDITQFYAIVLMFIMAVYIVQFAMCISLVLKNIYKSMIAIVIIWVILQIGGLIVINIPFVSGKVSIIDGNSFYAQFFKIIFRGTVPPRELFMESIFIGWGWCVILFFVGLLTIKRNNKVVSENI